MLISFFLQPFTGGQGQTVSPLVGQTHFNIQAEGQGSLRQAIMYTDSYRWGFPDGTSGKEPT